MTIDPYTAPTLTGAIIGQPWHEDAVCSQTDPEAFWPEKGGSTAAAKAVCNGGPGQDPCPVRAECLKWALDNNEYDGIYGGLSPRERRRLNNGTPTVDHRAIRRAEAHELYEQGLTYAAIATRYGVTAETASRWVKDYERTAA